MVENGIKINTLTYSEPPVVLGSGGPLFPSSSSFIPLPIPPPPASRPAEDIPVPSSGSSSSDKENSSLGSFQSTQQVVGELVEIVEADLDVDDKEAQALLDVMDVEVSRLYQCCKSKQHPQ